MEQPRGPARWPAHWLAVIRDASRQRKLASLAIALLLESLIVLLLLTLGAKIAGEEDEEKVFTPFVAIEMPPEPQPETAQPPAAEEQASAAAPQQPVPDTALPLPEAPRPSPLSRNPQPAPPPQPPAQPQPEARPSASPSPKIGARIRPGAAIGPADTGNPRTVGDSEKVGTARNGEPLYAARWYREPTDQELAGYLSTANGPGYALIECKVVSGYYVEDCGLLAEGPQGSMMGRAVLAAAWQFRVRPARLGGREQFGTWVRIRIDYTVRRAKP